jgi:hypothetical protein
MITLLSVLLLASETPAAVNPASETPIAAEATKAERKICKREGSTESRLGSKRICLTAAEWKARDTGEMRGLGDVTK